MLHCANCQRFSMSQYPQAAKPLSHTKESHESHVLFKQQSRPEVSNLFSSKSYFDKINIAESYTILLFYITLLIGLEVNVNILYHFTH